MECPVAVAGAVWKTPLLFAVHVRGPLVEAQPEKCCVPETALRGPFHKPNICPKFECSLPLMPTVWAAKKAYYPPANFWLSRSVGVQIGLSTTLPAESASTSGGSKSLSELQRIDIQPSARGKSGGEVDLQCRLWVEI